MLTRCGSGNVRAKGRLSTPSRSHCTLIHSPPGTLPHQKGSSRQMLTPSRPHRTFIDFPPEIIRLIFEHAAVMSRHTSLSLTLVSKEVRGWVEPIIYRTVILWTSHTVDLFRVAFDTKPRSFFATYVKNLFINGKYGADIILACSNLERLAAYPLSFLKFPEPDVEGENCLHPVPGQTSLLRRVVDLCSPSPSEVMIMGYLDDVPWDSSLLRNVEHLYLGIEQPTPETASEISLLPCLVCCAFPYDGDEEDALIRVVTTLMESSTLEYLIVLVNDKYGHPDRDRKGSIWSKLMCISDKRLLVGTEHSFDGNEWFSAVNNGDKLWETWIQECRDWRAG